MNYSFMFDRENIGGIWRLFGLRCKNNAIQVSLVF